MSQPGAQAPQPGSTPRRSGPTWVAVRVLLLVGIVVPLLVPFFYWFQFLMIPIVSVLTYTAFRLSLRATERDRPRFGLPADDRPQDRGKDS